MIPTWGIQPATTIRGCLVRYFEQQFSVFKQHYTYFYILFYSHIFSKTTNNVTKQYYQTAITPFSKLVKRDEENGVVYA